MILAFENTYPNQVVILPGMTFTVFGDDWAFSIDFLFWGITLSSNNFYETLEENTNDTTTKL